MEIKIFLMKRRMQRVKRGKRTFKKKILLKNQSLLMVME